LDAHMAIAFQNWLTEINARDIETSPAYDVVGGRFSRGGFDNFFDTEDFEEGQKVTMKKGQFHL